MTELSKNEPGLAFWFMAGFFLVFNLSGLMIYYQQVTLDPAVIAQEFSPAELAFVTGTPKWSTAAFALAVNSGILASILLLLRKTWSIPIFVFSLVCILLHDIDGIILRDGADVYGSTGLTIAGVIIAVSVIEIWYSIHVRAKDWLS